MRPSAAIIALVVAVSLSGDVAYAQIKTRPETGGEPYRGTGGVRYVNSRVAAAGIDSDIAAVTANWYRHKWRSAAATTTTIAPAQQPPPSRLSQPPSHYNPVKIKLEEDSASLHKKRPKPEKNGHHKRRHHHGEYIQHAKKLQALTAGSSEYRAIQEGSYFDNRTVKPVPPLNTLTKDNRLFDWERKRQRQQQRYWRTTTTTTQRPQAWAAREGYVGAPSTPRPDNAEQVRRNRAWAEYMARLSSSSSTEAPQPVAASSGSSSSSSVAYHRGRRPALHSVIHNAGGGVSYAAGSYFAHRTSSSARRATVGPRNQRRNRVTSTTASPTTTTTTTAATTTAAAWQPPADYEDEDYNYNSNSNNENNNNRNRHFEDDYDESVHPLERLLRG